MRDTAWKVSKYEVISGPYFSVFSPNTGKYGPEITPYLDIFHTVTSKQLLTVALLEEAMLEAQFVDNVINEKVIKPANICPVDMKPFETTVKCSTCNAVIASSWRHLQDVLKDKKRYAENVFKTSPPR